MKRVAVASGSLSLTDKLQASGFPAVFYTRDKTSLGGEERRARGHSPIRTAPETVRAGILSEEAVMYCFSLAAISGHVPRNQSLPLIVPFSYSKVNTRGVESLHTK